MPKSSSPLYKEHQTLQFSDIRRQFYSPFNPQKGSNQFNMKHSIVMIFVSLTVSVCSQSPAATWTNPYFYYHYNTPIALPTPQINSVEKVTASNQNVFSGHDDHSMTNTLGSHVVMLSTCLRELKTTRADLDQTTHRLDQTHNVVESVKNELKGNSQLLANVMATVENMKKEMNVSAASSIGRIPKSCDDLQTIGHRKSGIYSVKQNSKVENLYCDFTKKSDDKDFQQSIGFVNVKSTSVYFHAQRIGIYDGLNTGISFNKIGINVGNALDTSTGVFVAPVSGKYSFAYSGLCLNINTRTQMQSWQTKVAAGSATWSKVGDAHCTPYNTLSIQSTLQLAKGDQVRIFLLEGKTHDADGHNFTNYVGWLQEEDIV